ncbi:MAG: hypothetical protein ACR2H1_07665 [Limisphaerales bacterium]
MRRFWNSNSQGSNVARNVPGNASGNVPPGTRRYGGWGILWLVILAVIVVLLIAMWWR